MDPAVFCPANRSLRGQRQRATVGLASGKPEVADFG
jgi:hypothetical protein